MFAKLSPVVMLVLAITACSKSPSTVPAKDTARAPIADVALGEPTIVDASESVSPPRAETLHEKEALPRHPGDTNDYVKAGDDHMKAGRALEAVGAFRIALSIDDGAETWRKLGEAYLAAGDDGRGVACLEEAVSVDTGLVSARKALARHALANNDGDKALLHAEELVRQRPLDPTVRQMLGRAQMQERMWKEAIASFQLVVRDEPDNIFAHNNIGYSAIQIGALELAREHLERTLSLEPQQGYMLNNLGVTYERLGRAAEAHAAFSRAAELSPRYAQAKLNRDRLQAGLTQDERITSAETLVSMREPTPLDGSEDGGDLDGGDLDGASDTGGDATIERAMDAAAGGSARLAPADSQ
jgi:tetratricopeptide (TPR) repeat protein